MRMARLAPWLAGSLAVVGALAAALPPGDHARLGGFVQERGIMAMAILGNVVTSLSGFGVNMLGVGLHSYGFMDRAFWALFAFIGSQGVFLVLALAPARLGRLRAVLPAGERLAVSGAGAQRRR